MHEPDFHRDLVVRSILIKIANVFFGTKTPSQPCTLSTRLIGPNPSEGSETHDKRKKR